MEFNQTLESFVWSNPLVWMYTHVPINKLKLNLSCCKIFAMAISVNRAHSSQFFRHRLSTAVLILFTGKSAMCCTGVWQIQLNPGRALWRSTYMYLTTVGWDSFLSWQSDFMGDRICVIPYWWLLIYTSWRSPTKYEQPENGGQYVWRLEKLFRPHVLM